MPLNPASLDPARDTNPARISTGGKDLFPPPESLLVAAEAHPGEMTIGEHVEAIALVAMLRPFCTRWIVDIRQPETALEVGLIVMGDGVTPGWAIYRDTACVLHFEDLAGGCSYVFGTMSAGLSFVRGVLEAARSAAAETPAPVPWWQWLPSWLVEDVPGPLPGPLQTPGPIGA